MCRFAAKSNIRTVDKRKAASQIKLELMPFLSGYFNASAFDANAQIT
jgi:hypothetical protein